MINNNDDQHRRLVSLRDAIIVDNVKDNVMIDENALLDTLTIGPFTSLNRSFTSQECERLLQQLQQVEEQSMLLLPIQSIPREQVPSESLDKRDNDPTTVYYHVQSLRDTFKTIYGDYSNKLTRIISYDSLRLIIFQLKPLIHQVLITISQWFEDQRNRFATAGTCSTTTSHSSLIVYQLHAIHHLLQSGNILHLLQRVFFTCSTIPSLLEMDLQRNTSSSVSGGSCGKDENHVFDRLFPCKTPMIPRSKYEDWLTRALQHIQEELTKRQMTCMNQLTSMEELGQKCKLMSEWFNHNKHSSHGGGNKIQNSFKLEPIYHSCDKVLDDYFEICKVIFHWNNVPLFVDKLSNQASMTIATPMIEDNDDQQQEEQEEQEHDYPNQDDNRMYQRRLLQQIRNDQCLFVTVSLTSSNSDYSVDDDLLSATTEFYKSIAELFFLKYFFLCMKWQIVVFEPIERLFGNDNEDEEEDNDDTLQYFNQYCKNVLTIDQLLELVEETFQRVYQGLAICTTTSTTNSNNNNINHSTTMMMKMNRYSYGSLFRKELAHICHGFYQRVGKYCMVIYSVDKSIPMLKAINSTYDYLMRSVAEELTDDLQMIQLIQEELVLKEKLIQRTLAIYSPLEVMYHRPLLTRYLSSNHHSNINRLACIEDGLGKLYSIAREQYSVTAISELMLKSIDCMKQALTIVEAQSTTDHHHQQQPQQQQSQLLNLMEGEDEQDVEIQQLFSMLYERMDSKLRVLKESKDTSTTGTTEGNTSSTGLSLEEMNELIRDVDKLYNEWNLLSNLSENMEMKPTVTHQLSTWKKRLIRMRLLAMISFLELSMKNYYIVGASSSSLDTNSPDEIQQQQQQQQQQQELLNKHIVCLSFRFTEALFYIVNLFMNHIDRCEKISGTLNNAMDSTNLSGTVWKFITACCYWVEKALESVVIRRCDMPLVVADDRILSMNGFNTTVFDEIHSPMQFVLAKVDNNQPFCNLCDELYVLIEECKPSIELLIDLVVDQPLESIRKEIERYRTEERRQTDDFMITTHINLSSVTNIESTNEECWKLIREYDNDRVTIADALNEMVQRWWMKASTETSEMLRRNDEF